MKPSLEAPLQALCKSPEHLKTDEEKRAGVRTRRAQRSGRARAKAIKRKKGEI